MRLKIYSLLCSVLVTIAASAQDPSQPSARFVGSQSCEACHPAQTSSHAQTGHARALNKALKSSPGEWALGAGKIAITYVSRDTTLSTAQLLSGA